MTDITQGSAEWLALRIGRVTASRIYDVVARTKKGEPTAARRDYMIELLIERLTGRATEHYVSPAMSWGIAIEPKARTAYAFYQDVAVESIGFVTHPTIIESGASPDGTIGDYGLVEFKCPMTRTHVETLLTQKIDPQYIAQMMWQMACTGRDWCDFVSYDPRLPEEMRMFVKRVHRDNTIISSMEYEVREFLAELDAKITALHKKFAAPAIDHTDRDGLPAFLERTKGKGEAHYAAVAMAAAMEDKK